MTIKHIREFIKQHRQLLTKWGILTVSQGFLCRNYTVLDVAGFIHRAICGAIGTHCENYNNPSIADQILHRVANCFDPIVKVIEDNGQELFMVFDPIKVNTELPYAKLKLQTIQKRNEYAQNYQDVAAIKKLMYFYLKDYYADRPRVHIIVSQLEADIMVGSIVKRLLLQKHVDKSEITIISTDCDMLVQSQGCLYQDESAMIDTAKFFAIFGLTDMKDIAAVPEYLGCDYTQKSQNLQYLSLKQNFNYTSLIYKIYRDPDEIENNLQLTYENPQWEQELRNLFAQKVENTDKTFEEDLMTTISYHQGGPKIQPDCIYHADPPPKEAQDSSIESEPSLLKQQLITQSQDVSQAEESQQQ